MKNALIALLLLLTIAACSDKKDPEPELTGTYQMTRLVDPISNTDVTLPSVVNGRNVSGTIDVVQLSDTRYTWQGFITANGRATPGDVVPIELRKATGRAYDIIDNGTRTGSIDGTEFTIDYIDTTGRIVVAGRK